MSTQSQRRANGIDLLRTLGGGSYDPARAATAMVRRHGALGTFAVDHVLGNLWSRPQLSRRDRSLIVVTFLATIGSIEELRSHVGGALQHGVTRAEIEEVILQVAGYAGYPMAMQATRIVDEVFCAIDGIERQPERREATPKDDPQRWADATDVLVDVIRRTDARPIRRLRAPASSSRSAASANSRSTGDSASCGRAHNCRAATAAS